MIIGITGKSGSGKSTYAEKLAMSTNYFVLHIDEIGHKVLEYDNIKSKLIEIFGADSVLDGTVNRKHIGDLIFTHRHLYNKLTELVWESMKQEIDKVIESHDNIILDWLLLPHTHYWKLCDKKILITLDNEGERISRLMKRDNVSIDYLSKRDSASIDYSNIEFDEIIKN